MPTPSKPERTSEFGAGSSPPRRSIFGNYKAEVAAAPAVEGGILPRGSRSEPQAGTQYPASVPPDDAPGPADAGTGGISAATLQSSIDTAMARSFIYRLLAKAYENPEAEGWQWLCSASTKSALASAASSLSPREERAGREPESIAVELRARASALDVRQCEDRLSASEMSVTDLASRLRPDEFDGFLSSYVTCFGHTVRGDCPINEIEYADIKADPLFQPHRLADLAAFYAAFGLEMTPDGAERQDHISIELEFMCVLAAKEAYALEHQFDHEHIVLVRDAQRKFLREHLGRWAPAFTRRLARLAGDTTLGALAEFTRQFITADCARFNVTSGSDDLLLRPIDEAAESLCASCGLNSLPPGATRSLVEG